jgi:hypothetical protein
MYHCKTCKKQLEGEPALINACGSFCANCEIIRKQKMQESILRRNHILGGLCMWCGDSISKMPIGEKQDHVCDTCKHNRDWLLKCIRFSDKAARYTATREEIESVKRQEMAKMAARQTEIASIKPNETEARILRMEQMLAKLTSALGE